MSAVNEALVIVSGCLSFLGILELYCLTIGISAVLLMGLWTLLCTTSARLRGIKVKAAFPSDSPIAMACSTALNALVVLLVPLKEVDEPNFGWGAFWHGYVVALIVIGFLLPLEAICMALESYYGK